MCIRDSYNSLSVLTFIGNATSMASESVLVDIGRFVHRISLEEMKKGTVVYFFFVCIIKFYFFTGIVIKDAGLFHC